MVKKIYGLLLMIVCTLPVFSQNKDAVLGRWLNASAEAQILIFKTDDNYHGKIVYLKNPTDNGKPKLDTKNPDISQQKRPLLGAEILKGFVYKDGIWQNGSIYDPKTGKTYSCKMTLINNDKLDIRGFVGISIFGRTETWSRVR